MTLNVTVTVCQTSVAHLSLAPKPLCLPVDGLHVVAFVLQFTSVVVHPSRMPHSFFKSMTQPRCLSQVLLHFLNQTRIRDGQRKNLDHALTELSHISSCSKTPPRIQKAWKQCLLISREAFLLFSAAFARDLLCHTLKKEMCQIIETIKSQNQELQKHGLLIALSQEYGSRIDACQYSSVY